MSRLKEQFKLGEAFSYFIRVFQKPDPNKPTNLNIRAMHTINKISIIMALFAFTIVIYRLITR